MWMQEALDRSKREVQKTISEEDALEYLAFSLYKQGNLQRALVETEKLVKLGNSGMLRALAFNHFLRIYEIVRGIVLFCFNLINFSSSP